MNELTVFTRATPDAQRFEVTFANGVQRQGLLRIDVPFPVAKPDVAAELGALHHLLVERAIYGDDRAGNRLYLTVSRGQTKKLIEGRSASPELAPWASALAVQFFDAQIRVENRNADWEKPRRFEHVTEFALADRLDWIYTVPTIGPLRLTVHAVEQFCARSNYLARHAGWRQIRYMLSPALVEVRREDALAELAAGRHGTTARILYAPASGWNLVVVLPDERNRVPTIVTIYHQKRKPWMLTAPTEFATA